MSALIVQKTSTYQPTGQHGASSVRVAILITLSLYELHQMNSRHYRKNYRSVATDLYLSKKKKYIRTLREEDVSHLLKKKKKRNLDKASDTAYCIKKKRLPL